MISRKNRLSSKAFAEAMKAGKAFSSRLFIVRASIGTHSDTKPPKVAAVAPVKSFSKAVARNRAKRRAYEAIKPLLSRLRDGASVIVISKKAGEEPDLGEMREELHGLFEKAGLLR